MPDISKLRTILNNSGIQISNNALYQVVNDILSTVSSIVGGVLPGPITVDVVIKKEFGQVILQDGESVSKGRIQVSLRGNRIDLSQNLYVDPSGRYNLDDTSKSGWAASLIDSSNDNSFQIIRANPAPNPITPTLLFRIDTAGNVFSVGNIAASNYLEKNRSVPLGSTINEPFVASNFTSVGGMVWTVTAGGVSANYYTLVGNVLSWNLILGSTLSGTASNELRVRIPGGFGAAKATDALGIMYQGTYVPCLLITGAGGGLIQIFKMDTSNFAIGALSILFQTNIIIG